MAKIIWKRQRIFLTFKLLGCLVCVAFIICAFKQSSDACDCDKTSEDFPHDPGGKAEKHEHGYRRGHRLAVIVPYRDRLNEMMTFVPHIHKYLKAKEIDHKIYIINQVDDLRFNRASLINIGYLLSRTECDYIAMHDVDLLPLNPTLNYTYPSEGPFHVAAPKLHPKYHYKAFIGGILLISNNHFKLINGMSNKYYGWGMEDDEFYVRILEMNLAVRRPQHIKAGSNTFHHVHDKKERPRDYKQYGNQRKLSRQRDRETGVDSVDFDFKYIKELTIDNAPVTFVGVVLNCDVEQTPWCMHPDQTQEKLKNELKRNVAKEAAMNVEKKPTAEEKRLEEIKESIIKYQDQITEFRKSIRPLRTVKPEELPKWMKPN